MYRPDFEYNIVYSKRLSVSIEIRPDATVLVRAGRGMSDSYIERILKEKEKWIHTHIEKVKGRSPALDFYSYSDAEVKRLKALASEYIPQRVEYYSSLMGVCPSAVRFNSAKKIYGSCSMKNSINFSAFLMLYPKHLIDYVVVHELCHIKEHNHSRRFYECIADVMPDYKSREKELRDFRGE